MATGTCGTERGLDAPPGRDGGPSARGATREPPAGAWADPGWMAPSYRSSTRRVFGHTSRWQAEADRDRLRAAALYAELAALPCARRPTVVASERRFASWSLADLLVTEAEETADRRGPPSAEGRADDPSPTALAELALAAIDRLEPGGAAPGLVSDVKARAWALLGEAWTEEESEDGAERAARTAFRLARRHLDHGSGDPLEEAALLFREAVPGHPESFERNLERLDRALSIFLEHGDLRDVRRSLRRMGRILVEADLPCRIEG